MVPGNIENIKSRTRRRVIGTNMRIQKYSLLTISIGGQNKQTEENRQNRHSGQDRHGMAGIDVEKPGMRIDIETSERPRR